MRFTVALIVVLLVIACGGGRRDLQPMVLPDLTRVEEPVRKQIRERHAAFTAKLAERSASEADVATAAGEYGLVLHAAEYFDLARIAYANAEKLAPQDPRWPYYLGILSRTESRMDVAAAAFERALRLRPDDVPTLVWLGRTYMDLAQPAKAQAQFARARRLAPREVAPLAGLGQAALAQRDYPHAISLLEEALALNPAVLALHAPLAQAYRARSNEQQAQAHMAVWKNSEVPLADPLKDALDTTLNSGLSYQLRGIRALSLRDFAEAERVLREGVSMTSPDTELGRSLRQKLGTALAMRGDVRAATEQFEAVTSAVAADVRDEPAAKAQYSIGVMRAGNGNSRDAVQHFRRAVAHDPAYVEAYVALGAALRDIGEDAAAIAAYREAIRMSPRAVDARLGYAYSLLHLRRYADARRWLVDSLAEQPGEPHLSLALARLYAATPDARVRSGRQAFAITQELLKTQPRTTELGETMAMTMAELGNFQEAVAIQRDIIESARRAGLTRDVERMQRNLVRYERGEPCREPGLVGSS